jgi:hypothetical protein
MTRSSRARRRRRHQSLLFLEHRAVFDVVVAISVFMHFDLTMAGRCLGYLRDAARPRGYLFLT